MSFIYILQIFHVFQPFFFFFKVLNNKPCCEPRLVSSVMADFISIYYFFEQNSINNLHNLSARNILVKCSFLKSLLIKSCYYFHLYQYNSSFFYHGIQTVSFNYRSKGHKANRLYGKYAFTAAFE